MRLLCVGNRYPPWSMGGYEIISAGTVAALRERGHQVRVLTTVPDPTDRADAEAVDADVHRELRWYWRAHEFPSLGLSTVVELERANARVIVKQLREFEPDAVVWWAMGGMSLSLLERVRAAGVPALAVVGDDWMTYGVEVDQWARRWRGWRRPLARFAELVTGIPAGVELGHCARFAFISEHVRAAAVAAGWEFGGSLVVHPGVDPVVFARREPGRWQWRLLYCGRIDERKGIATAVQALPSLPEQATLTVDGTGNPRHQAELETLAAQLEVAARVRFRCSEPAAVPDAYAAADAVVFPVTWSEPWGLVPLEAMAVGRPLVASRAGGGPSEYLVDGGNCLQFEPGDATGLAERLHALAGDAELRERVTEGGSRTAVEFTSERFYAAIEAELLRLTAP